MQQSGKGKTESVQPCGKSVDKADKRWIAVLKLCLFSGSSEMVRFRNGLRAKKRRASSAQIHQGRTGAALVLWRLGYGGNVRV